jgi:hypothetical protein
VKVLLDAACGQSRPRGSGIAPQDPYCAGGNVRSSATDAVNGVPSSISKVLAVLDQLDRPEQYRECHGRACLIVALARFAAPQVDLHVPLRSDSSRMFNSPTFPIISAFLAFVTVASALLPDFATTTS